MSAPFRLRVTGRSGHASMPAIADNALVKAAPLIEKLGAYRAERRLIPEVDGAVGLVTGSKPRIAGRRARDRARHRRHVRRDDRAAAVDDADADDGQCIAEAERRPGNLRHRRRLPPPAGADRSRREQRSSVECSARATTSSSGSRRRAARARRSSRRCGTRSSRSSTTRPGRARAPDLRRRLHRQPLVPRGVRHGRLRLLPARTMDVDTAARLIHSADERVPVEDLELGVDWLRHAARSTSSAGATLSAWRDGEKVRLGGMALSNGVLVHGPTAWACAVRMKDGELKVAASRKRFRASRVESPLVRGPAKLPRRSR